MQEFLRASCLVQSVLLTCRLDYHYKYVNNSTEWELGSLLIKGKNNGESYIYQVAAMGVIISNDMGPHITMIHGEASQRLYVLRLLKRAGVECIHIARIRITCPLTLGTCLPSVAHEPHCFRF